ncbi:MAG: right-handed parallel beta-helix repeat-containing protein [Candidatus Heimdallarchaeota archaeon]|nr:right-handed parallel beta-helix repeat-containing protein [Candidatus Heimdallarchaeota archaeon]
MRFLFLISLLILGFLCFPSNDVQAITEEQSSMQNLYENQTSFIGLILRDIQFEFYQLDEVVFIDNTMENVTISIMEVNNVTIMGNTFNEVEDVAILIWKSNNVTIERNSFHNLPTYAIGIYESTSAQLNNNTIILAEEFYNQWFLIVGINVDRSPRTTVKFNDVYSPIGDGVYIHSSENSTVYCNTIHHTGFIGLSLINSPYTLVYNNSITDSSSYQLHHSGDIPASSAVGISASPGVILRYNIIDYSDNTGIDIDSSSDTIIEYNTIINHPTAIFVGRSDNVIIRFNIFYNNGVDIEYDQSDNLLTQGNVVTESSPIVATTPRTSNQAESEDEPPYYLLLIIPIIGALGYLIQRKRSS